MKHILLVSAVTWFFINTSYPVRAEGNAVEKMTVEQFLKEAVLYGLQKDMMDTALVNVILKADIFVPKCPVSTPVKGAFQYYVSNPIKVPYYIGDMNLHDKFISPDRAVRQQALKLLISRYVQFYYDHLNLPESDREAMDNKLKKARKQGMSEIPDDFGKSCPSCDGACGIDLANSEGICEEAISFRSSCFSWLNELFYEIRPGETFADTLGSCIIEAMFSNCKGRGAITLKYEGGTYEESGKLVSAITMKQDTDIVVTPMETVTGEYYEEKSLSITEWYYEPLRDSIWQYTDEDGSKRTTTWKKGILSGEAKGWYKNDQLQFRAFYVDDKRHGIQKKWYENGNQESEVTFVHGNPQGKSTNWYENGQIHSIGELDVINSREAIQLEGEFAQSLNVEAVLKAIGRFDVRKGLWKVYNQDGSKKFEGAYTGRISVSAIDRSNSYSEAEDFGVPPLDNEYEEYFQEMVIYDPLNKADLWVKPIKAK